MTDYYCVFRESTVSVWVSQVAHPSEEHAVTYAEAVDYMTNELVSVISCGARPRTPVGMRADQASHRWVRTIGQLRVGPWRLEPRSYMERHQGNFHGREESLYDACCRAFSALACRDDDGPLEAIRKAQSLLDKAIGDHQASAISTQEEVK